MGESRENNMIRVAESPVRSTLIGAAVFAGELALVIAALVAMA